MGLGALAPLRDDAPGRRERSAPPPMQPPSPESEETAANPTCPGTPASSSTSSRGTSWTTLRGCPGQDWRPPSSGPLRWRAQGELHVNVHDVQARHPEGVPEHPAKE